MFAHGVVIFGLIIANCVSNSNETITLDKTKFDMFEAIQKETKSTCLSLYGTIFYVFHLAMLGVIYDKAFFSFVRQNVCIFAFQML